MSAITFTERKRQQKQRYRGNNPGLLYSDDLPFVGVDGEGGTTVDGSHAYFLLRAGEDVISSGEEGLSTAQILDFLSDLPRGVHYVAYFFDYDTTKSCEDLPFGKLWKLIHRNERLGKHGTPFPVDVMDDRYQIDYLPGKEFKVRKRREDGSFGPFTVINDVGSFFQCAFTQAIETWQIGTPEQRAAIKAGKDYRNRFRAIDLPDIDKYNYLEIRLLEQLMEDFRRQCKRSGYVPRRWQGPGQLAESMMRAHGIPKATKTPLLQDEANRELLEFASAAFYGGRPEVTKLGPVAPVYQYDINSAYPWALLHVPCLTHGSFDRWDGTPFNLADLSRPALLYGHFKPKKEGKQPFLYGLPVRRESGTIYYPGEGYGWYWSFEIAAAKHQTFEIEDGFIYRPKCQCVPFDFVRNVYAMRLRVGKDTLGIVLKLALNSLYGKIAQSIGNPKYANPIWASFITAFCRAQIMNLIHGMDDCKRGACGRNVVMVATDAVFTTVELPISDSTDLGEFSVKSLPDGIFIVQPGMYYRGDTAEKIKTRGVPRNRMEELRADFAQAYITMTTDPWEREGEGPRKWASVRVPLKTFIGLRLALHRRNKAIMGQWIGCEHVRTEDHTDECVPYEKEISFDCTTKRIPGLPTGPGKAIQTYPYPGSPDTVTVPYASEIGAWREIMRLETVYDQPDWSSILMSEEL